MSHSPIPDQHPSPLLFRKSDGSNVIGRRPEPVSTDEPLIETDFDDAGPETWRSEAVCATTDPELFFRDTDGGSSYMAARRICASCPVREACQDDAMSFEASTAGRRYGMYGGLTPRERAALAVSTGFAPSESQREAA